MSGLFFAEGIRIVAEAVELRAEVETCVMAPELLTSELGRKLVGVLRESGVPCLEVTAEVFKSISLKDGPQGIGVVARQRWEQLESVRFSGELCWVALHRAADPGNVGTILRTLDAVGGAGVILVGPSTDPYDPAAVRASMGAIFAQQTVRAGLDELAVWKSKTGYALVGTSGTAETDYQDVSYHSPLVLFLGSEREGLSAGEQEPCDVMVRIPMVGRSDSLNLAVATGVLLYEIFSQQRRGTLKTHQKD
jgi:TrmH family RNA methyltransferase